MASKTEEKDRPRGAAATIEADAPAATAGAPTDEAAGPLVVGSGRDLETLETYGLKSAEVAILRKTVCKGAPPEMMAFFLAFCKRRKLDPFSRHVYLMPTRDNNETKWQIVSGIDGLRTIASRNVLYRGQSRPKWTFETIEEDGVEVYREFVKEDSKWGNIAGKRVPEECEVVVYRAIPGAPFDVPPMAFYGVCRFDEFVQRGQGGKIQGNWEKQPEHQLSIRAEAMALRKAFPEDVGSIYTEEELRDVEARERAVAVDEVAPPPLDGDPEDEQINTLAGFLNWPLAMVHAQLRQRGGDKAALLAYMQEEALKKDGSRRSREDAEDAQFREVPPEAVTKATRDRLFGALSRFDPPITDKPDRIRWCKSHGVDVGSFTELTEAQASGLLQMAFDELGESPEDDDRQGSML